MVKMISTTNPNFQYLVGAKERDSDFNIGVSIFFGNFHTSRLIRLDYRYGQDQTVTIKAQTVNSVYTFRIGGNDDE